jgi:hypothetical protein
MLPAVTFGLTVNVFTALNGLLHPVFNVYFMSVVPALTAVTNPVVAFTVATAVFVLLHTPFASPLLV